MNIKAQQAITFQTEYWDLEGCHNLNQIYEEIKDDTRHLVNLSKSVRAAGMDVPHAVTLLNFANNDLPTLEYSCERLKQDVNSLQERKRRLYNQVTKEGSNLEYYRVACQREIANLRDLQQKRSRLETLVTHFEDNNEEYGKIRKTVEEKTRATLSNGKKLVKLAVLSVTESIRENPAKYGSLIQQDMSSTTAYFNQDFNPFYMYGQQPPQQHAQSKVYFIEKYVAMLLADTEKLYNILAKDVVDEILNDRTVSKASPTLPMSPTMDENFARMDR